MRTMVVVGAGMVAAVAVVAALLAVAPFDAAAEVGDVTAPAPAGEVADRRTPRPGELLEGVLAELVDEGAISADQAEAITERVQDRAEEVRAEMQKRRRIRHLAAKLFSGIGAALREATGLTPEELTAAWRSGSTVGEIATESGVDEDELEAALVATAEERIDTWLDAGRIDDDQAEQLSSGVEDRAPRVVERIWDRSRDDR